MSRSMLQLHGTSFPRYTVLSNGLQVVNIFDPNSTQAPWESLHLEATHAATSSFLV